MVGIILSSFLGPVKPTKDNSFGIVPLTYRQNFWEVFLVQHLNGAHWGFPKGRAEKGESLKQTAERELFEETGMKVIRYLDHPYFVETTSAYENLKSIDRTIYSSKGRANATEAFKFLLSYADVILEDRIKAIEDGK